MYPETIAALEDARSRGLSSPRYLGILAYAYALSGNRDRALRIVEELKLAAETDDDAPIRLAQAFVGLDDKDRAFERLEKAYQRRAPRLTYRLQYEPRSRLRDLMNYPCFLPMAPGRSGKS